MVNWGLQKNNIQNTVNHPEFNVTTVVSKDVDPTQREMGYLYKMNVTYPMNTFDPYKSKSYYFKDIPGGEEISATVESFLAEMEQNIEEKPVQSVVDEKVIKSLDTLKERLQNRKNQAGMQESESIDLANDLVLSKEQISDDELIQIVGLDLFKGIQKQEGLLGEGVVDRNRMMDTARQIQKIDKKDRLLPEHIFESLQHESGYLDNWQDLRNVIEKGGIDINYEGVQRLIQVGVNLPKDIIDEFKKSEQYKNANPELDQDSEVGQDGGINNILSFVTENQALVDEFFLQKGIDLSELITFTDENGNPC
jgi:hypothetical protein